MSISTVEDALREIEAKRSEELETYWRGKAAGVAKHWTSQAEARAIVAEHGCKVCTWRYPGRIFEVSGDLWCDHCVREIGAELADLEPLHIPNN